MTKLEIHAKLDGIMERFRVTFTYDELLALAHLRQAIAEDLKNEPAISAKQPESKPDALGFAFTLRQTVYRQARAEKVKGKITAISIRPTGTTFGVTWGTGSESWHYDFELSDEFTPDYATN